MTTSPPVFAAGRHGRVLARAAALCTLLAGALVACGGGGSDGGIGGTGVSDGTLRMSLTDAPACGFEAVNVTVERVRVHQNPGATDADAGWREIVLAPPRRIDLLTLTNGTLEPLGQTRLPAGTYRQLRLVLADNDAQAPLENAVRPVGQGEVALKTPSAQQSGLKLDTGIVVPPGQEADVVIDFDACRSVVRAGNSGQYLLKPVLRVTTVLNDAGQRITGWVAPAQAASTRVSAQQNGVEIAAVQPLTSGEFRLFPLPAGAYDLVVTGSGRATTVLTGVPVVDGTPTLVFPQAQPLAAPVSARGVQTVAGTVATVPPTRLADVTVQITQTLADGTLILGAAPGVDADTGAFATDLPVDAPRVAAHALNGPPYAFAADTVAGGVHRVSARLDAQVQAASIDLSSVVPPLSFLFP